MTVIVIADGKLTKQFLMSQETGRYLVSTVYLPSAGGGFEPAFRETVLPLDQREEQWSRIKACNVNGRNCDVLADESDYEVYRDASPAPKSDGSTTES